MICGGVQFMPKNEEQNRGVGREVEAEQGAGETIDTYNSRLHHEVTGSHWKRRNPSSLQQAIQDDAFCGHYRGNIGRGSSEVVQRQYVEVTRVAGECSIGQKIPVCGGIDKEVEQNVGSRDEVINSILPTDRWADRTNKPRVGTVLEVLCGSQVEGLVRVVGVSRVCGKQQGSHGN